MARIWRLLGITVVAGCLGLLLPQAIFFGMLARLPVVPFTPPDTYRVWWQDIQRCSHIDALRSLPAFYVVQQPDFIMLNEHWKFVPAIGVYDRTRNRIYLGSVETHDWTTVGHEMLHALGVRNHKSALFDLCGVE